MEKQGSKKLKRQDWIINARLATAVFAATMSGDFLAAQLIS